MAMWSVAEWESESSAGLLARRTHPVLKDIDRLVRAYHLITGMESDAVPKRTAFLAAIVSRTGIYLSQHVDKKARRGAVEVLRQQATDELKRLPRPEEKRRGWDGIRFAGQLQGVKDRSHVSAGAFQPAIKMSPDYYLLEALNPAHLPADQALQDELEVWATKACKAENMSFHAMKAAARQQMMARLPPGARKNAGVTYLTDEEREGYRVNVTPAGLTWACEEGPLHSIGIPGPGDEANAGTKNGGGASDLGVPRIGPETRLAHIIHLVEAAQSRRAPVQSFVDRFARFYTPAVIGLAALSLMPLLWMLSESLMQPGEASAFPPPLLPAHATFENYHE